MTVTTPDIVLAAEMVVVTVFFAFAFAYAIREIQRLREQVRSIESEVKEHRKEIYTGNK